MNENRTGSLYLVGTPIGNLGDLSARALQTLRDVDFIAAEDTRVSLRLLRHFQIKKPLISYHEHNQRERGEQILARLLAGESCALITDAGMPCISDPGQPLVALCARHAVPVLAVPGPSAAVAALALSGLPTGRFAFEGFLSVSKGARARHLEQLRREPRTMVFYEAPHKLPHTLRDLYETFGERRIALCREMTKLHEEVVRTTLSEAAAHYEQNTPRGEFVLVVEGAPEPEEERVPLEDAVRLTLDLHAGGLPLSWAAKEAAARTGHKKSELYRQALRGGAEDGQPEA